MNKIGKLWKGEFNKIVLEEFGVRDPIVMKAMRYYSMALFYELKPNGKSHTLREISTVLGTSPGNARQWIDAASSKIPVTDVGVETDYIHKGPGGYLYGLIS